MDALPEVCVPGLLTHTPTPCSPTSPGWLPTAPDVQMWRAAQPGAPMPLPQAAQRHVLWATRRCFKQALAARAAGNAPLLQAGARRTSCGHCR